SHGRATGLQSVPCSGTAGRTVWPRQPRAPGLHRGDIRPPGFSPTLARRSVMNPLDLTHALPIQRAPRRRLASLRKLAPALLLSLAPLLGTGQTAVVHAASGDCTTSGSQITCTF